MRLCLRMAAVVILCLTVTASAALATKPQVRSGFFVGFGLGAGNATWDWVALNIDSPNEGSGLGNFRVGGAIRDDLVLGFESSAWVKDYDLVASGLVVGDAKVRFSAATFAATWFPGNRGAYLRAGVGVATARGETNLGVLELDATDRGAAILAASGYEWRLSDRFAVGPQVELVFLGLSGDVVDNVMIVDGSMQFNWYW